MGQLPSAAWTRRAPAATTVALGFVLGVVTCAEWWQLGWSPSITEHVMTWAAAILSVPLVAVAIRGGRRWRCVLIAGVAGAIVGGGTKWLNIARGHYPNHVSPIGGVLDDAFGTVVVCLIFATGALTLLRRASEIVASDSLDAAPRAWSLTGAWLLGLSTILMLVASTPLFRHFMWPRVFGVVAPAVVLGCVGVAASYLWHRRALRWLRSVRHRGAQTGWLVTSDADPRSPALLSGCEPTDRLVHQTSGWQHAYRDDLGDALRAPCDAETAATETHRNVRRILTRGVLGGTIAGVIPAALAFMVGAMMH